MSGTNGNGSKVAITPQSKLSLQLVIALLAATAAWVGMYYAQNAKLDAVHNDVRTLMRAQWTKPDDEAFMERFANYNDLLMADHRRITIPTKQ